MSPFRRHATGVMEAQQLFLTGCCRPLSQITFKGQTVLGQSVLNLLSHITETLMITRGFIKNLTDSQISE